MKERIYTTLVDSDICANRYYNLCNGHFACVSHGLIGHLLNMYLSPITLTNYIQGLDALGLATLDSITSSAIASIPFISLFSFPPMTDEDMVNLRTLRRLIQLLSGYQQTENSNLVRAFASPTLQ